MVSLNIIKTVITGEFTTTENGSGSIYCSVFLPNNTEQADSVSLAKSG